MSDDVKKRMGVDGNGYGEMVDSILGSCGHNMSREDFLRLAWACVDQVSGTQNVRLAQRALEAIEDMFDSEGPETLRDGQAPDPVRLSKEEQGMLLELPIDSGELIGRPDDRELLVRLVAKGLAYSALGLYALTEDGKRVAQMAGAT